MANDKLTFNTVWYEGIRGSGRIRSGDTFKSTIAIPELKGGSGAGAAPFQLLVSSAIACYTMTLRYMLHQKKLQVSGFYLDTESHEMNDDKAVIVHYPHIILAENATEEQLQATLQLIEGADKACHIGNILRQSGAELRVEGKVSVLSETDEMQQYITSKGLDWNV